MMTRAYDSLILHVMSGTGNSLRAARWLADLFGPGGATIVRIAKSYDALPAPDHNSLTGFVFPTHGFTAPWAVIRHAMRIPRGTGSDAFVVATRAGTWLGFLLPGLSASAMFVTAFLLMLKGYRIKGLRGLDMPSNWTALHWGMSPKNAQRIIDRARIDIERLAALIFSGKTHFVSINNFVELVGGIALANISAGYLLIGRFALAKLFYANWKCTSCGLCARECPFGAIRMMGTDPKLPYWTFACESCMHCMGYCPEKAVEASHPLAIAMFYVGTFSLAAALGAWIIRLQPGLSGIGAGPGGAFVRSAVNYAYVLVSFFLVYVLFYYLVRIPLVNRLFTYLTLTHYYRRYREPGIGGKDFTEGG